MEQYGTRGTMGQWGYGTCGSQSKGKLTWIQEMDRKGEKYSNLQQYSVWEIVTTWMQINTAEVPDFRNLNQGDWGSVGREQNNRIIYGTLLWPPHCMKLKESLPISVRFDFLPYPLPIFCFFLFRFLEPYLFIAFLMLSYTGLKILGCFLLPSIAEQ